MSSTVIAKNIQVGTSGTATNNFTWYQPAAPDGTVRLGVGNYGATTLDVVTVSNSGNVTVSGSLAGGALSGSSLAVSGAATTGSLTVNSNAISAVNSLGFRNRILNGGMVIDQRNAGASVTPANGAYTLDRWAAFTNGAGVYTVQQSSTAPAGFTNSLLCTVTTIDSSVTGTDYYMLQHKVEGFNSADLAWGSASAASVTLSFWVRSSITGTYSVKLGNSASDRFYIATYTISAANTWEQKTITLSGDTSGTWVTNNGTGIEIRFGLAIGSSFTSSTIGSWAAGNSFGATTASNNWIGTNGATFYITGVQLEAGTVASPFERRAYGQELLLCQRYCEVIRPSGATTYAQIGVGQAYATTAAQIAYFYQAAKRAQPTVTYDTASKYALVSATDVPFACTAIATNRADVTSLAITATAGTASFTAGHATRLLDNNTSYPATIISAEL